MAELRRFHPYPAPRWRWRGGYAPAVLDFVAGYYRTRSIKELARALGRDRQYVRGVARQLASAGRIRISDRACSRPWTAREEDFLGANLGARSWQTLARHLRRSVSALKSRAVKLRYRPLDNVITCTKVGEIFGVGNRIVHYWIAYGWIRAARSVVRRGPRGPVWDIDERSLMDFVERMPWAFDRSIMKPGHWLTEYANGLYRQAPFHTVTQLSQTYGWSQGTIYLWVQRGLIAHQRVAGGRGSRGDMLIFYQRDVDSFLRTHARLVDETRRRRAGGRRANPGRHAVPIIASAVAS